MSTFRKRSKRGQLIVELAAALPLIIAIMAVGLNGIFGLMAWLTLDGACIDAARAASMAPNQRLAEQRAQVAVESHRQCGIDPQVEMLEYHNENGDYSKDPYFVLRAHVDYKLPFPALSFGEKIKLPESLHLSRVYAYPILKIDLENLAAQAPAIAAGAAGGAPAPRVAIVPIGPGGFMASTAGTSIQPDLSGVP